MFKQLLTPVADSFLDLGTLAGDSPEEGPAAVTQQPGLNGLGDAAPVIGHGVGVETASSVAHDSHNIVAVGADDDSLAEAINAVIAHKGGVAAVGYPPDQRHGRDQQYDDGQHRGHAE